jgi:hypothetical protein
MRNFRRLVPVEHQPQNSKDENIKHRVTEFAEQTKKQNALLNPKKLRQTSLTNPPGKSLPATLFAQPFLLPHSSSHQSSFAYYFLISVCQWFAFLCLLFLLH